jgi:hypothetical protein
MRAQGSNGAHPPGIPDREVWRISRSADTSLDEAEHLLDLAALADGRLDEDDTARVAALVAHDGDAAADVDAARALAGATMVAADPGIIARAEALVGEGRMEAVLIPFPTPQPAVRPWYRAASWSGLAAAMVLAGWVGFDLGNGLSNSPIFGHPPDDVAAGELLDAAPLMVRDFNESARI